MHCAAKVFPSLGMRLPPAFAQTAGASLLNFELVGPECWVHGFDFVDRFWAFLCLPLVFAAMIALVHCAGLVCCSKRGLRKSVQHSLLDDSLENDEIAPVPIDKDEELFVPGVFRVDVLASQAVARTQVKVTATRPQPRRRRVRPKPRCRGPPAVAAASCSCCCWRSCRLPTSFSACCPAMPTASCFRQACTT